MPSGDTRSFCLAPGLAGSCTPRWHPQGKGSLPQTRVDKHSDSQGERSARCTPKGTHCNSSSELVFQVQTTSLAAHSVLLLTAQALGTFIFPPAFYLSLFAVLKVTDVGKLFISYTAPIIIHREFGRLTAGHTRTKNHFMSMLLGFLAVELF